MGVRDMVKYLRGVGDMVKYLMGVGDMVKYLMKIPYRTNEVFVLLQTFLISYTILVTH